MPAYRPIATLFVATLFSGALLPPKVADAGVPSFHNEVMAVLSRAGCNQGTCHGNLNGKGGFKLSIRGERIQEDFNTIVRSDGARRVDRIDAANSLLLLKPTMTIPHEGGRRFRPGDREYQILRDWIAGGMPFDDDAPTVTSLNVSPTEAYLDPANPAVRLTATATFSDGTQRDVTDLCVFEPSSLLAETDADGTVTLTGPGEVTVAVRYLARQVPVRLVLVPDRPDFAWQAPPPANYIDELVFTKLKRLKVNPSPVCDDATFLRRASLDLTGMLPTPAESRAFLSDSSPDKRLRLVDRLLAGPEFAMFWGLKWSDLVRAEEKTLDEKGVAVYVDWIRNSIAENKPLDEFARDLVTGRGSTYDTPPANFYRAMRDPITRAESVAQLFLGVRLQCAKCHNHPFDRWTQDDYYGWANNFSQIDYEIKENKRRDRSDKHEFVGEQVVIIDSEQKPVLHPETGKPVPPRFLDGGQTLPDPEGDRLNQLAHWLTDDNDQFAVTMANRIWAELLGRGIVDPIDDFRMTNPPANPELLEAVANDLRNSGYDLRSLIRTITASNVYQLSSQTNSTNAGDAANFSHTTPRRLSAEQLLDTMMQVTGAPVDFAGTPKGERAAAIVGVRAVHGRRSGGNKAEAFLKLFGKPPRLTPCDCERTDETTLAQAFQLISGELLDEMLDSEQNRLTTMAASDMTPEEMIETLYWAALTREPTDDERAAAIEHLTTADDRRQALEDVTWALLNSAEFLLRH